MDVQRFLLAVVSTIVLASCSNLKTSNTVFDDNGALDSNNCSGAAVKNKFIVQWEDGRFTVESAADADEFKRNFIEPNLQNIRRVEFDRLIQLDRATASAASSEQADSWGQEKIGASQLWAQGFKGQNIKVAVVDAFVDTAHKQLRSRIAINTAEIPDNGVDDDRNGIIDDYYGASFLSSSGNSANVSPHGSHVAGIIAADPTQGPIEGVAPEAQIIPAQFIGNDGGGSLGDAVMAMQYSVSRGATIINASWGGAPCVASLRNAFLELEKQGVLVVVAAGNEGRDIDVYPEFPASFDLSNQITVAASGLSDVMTSWSNSGFTAVHVAAPGERILSTIPDNSIAYLDGTSMAAPMVSGAAALIWSAYPQATAVQVKQALLQSVDVSSGREFKVKTRGRINALKALEALRQLVP